MVSGLKNNKVISLLLASSVLSMSMLPVVADEYMVLPPILDEETTKQDQPLPDFSQRTNNEVKTNNYDYSYNHKTNYADTNTQTTEL